MAPSDALPAARSPGRRSPHPLLILAVVTAAVALFGVPGGFVWAAVAPRVAVVVVGHGFAQAVNPETKNFIAADGWFCVVGAIGGLLVGAAGYVAAVRRHGAVAAAGLMLGGFGAALVQWWIGRSLGRGSFRSALLASHAGTVLHAPLMLRALDALVIWPLAAAVLVALAELADGQRRSAPRVEPI